MPTPVRIQPSAFREPGSCAIPICPLSRRWETLPSHRASCRSLDTPVFPSFCETLLPQLKFLPSESTAHPPVFRGFRTTLRLVLDNRCNPLSPRLILLIEIRRACRFCRNRSRQASRRALQLLAVIEDVELRRGKPRIDPQRLHGCRTALFGIRQSIPPDRFAVPPRLECCAGSSEASIHNLPVPAFYSDSAPLPPLPASSFAHRCCIGSGELPR